ncbi:MAG: response regulator, partial [Gammaproteobacteria bacterium]|nr:response regulator [Gammaproteobacteria bacterium]
MADTILIADDDTELCELLREYLEPEGFEVRLAHDGDRALAEARAPGLDAMVLDIMMPGRSGIEVLKALRADSSLPVIMLTARGDDLDRILGLELGADDYLPKPCNPRELVARIRAVLRRAGGAVTSGVLSVEDLELHPGSRGLLRAGER